MLTTNAGKTVAVQDAAILQAADAIRKGMIVAVKGIGGSHLMGNRSMIKRCGHCGNGSIGGETIRTADADNH